jgi:tetratricopeptide (TPR) repeat protein
MNMRVCSRALFGILLAVSSARLPAAQTGGDPIREGLEAYLAGDRVTALKKLRQAHQAKPDDANARLYLGLVLYEGRNDSPEAQGLMESVSDSFAENGELQLKLLDSYLASGKRPEALELLRRRQALLDANESLALQAGYQLLRYGVPEAAQEQSRRIVARRTPPETGNQVVTRPDAVLGEALFINGLAAATQERKPEALRSLQAADRQGFPPLESPQMLVLADILFDLAEPRLAGPAYERYLQNHPGDHSTRMSLGACMLAVGRFEEALEQFRLVSSKEGSHPLVHYRLGEALLELKRAEEADREFREELQRNPSCYRSLTKLAYLHYLQGDNDGALELLNRARALEPTWIDIYLGYGLLYNRLGKYDLAIENLKIVNRQMPDLPTAHLQLSIAYQRSGDAQNATFHRDAYNRLLTRQKEEIIRGVDKPGEK